MIEEHPPFTLVSVCTVLKRFPSWEVCLKRAPIHPGVCVYSLKEVSFKRGLSEEGPVHPGVCVAGGQQGAGAAAGTAEAGEVPAGCAGTDRQDGARSDQPGTHTSLRGRRHRHPAEGLQGQCFSWKEMMDQVLVEGWIQRGRSGDSVVDCLTIFSPRTG